MRGGKEKVVSRTYVYVQLNLAVEQAVSAPVLHWLELYPGPLSSTRGGPFMSTPQPFTGKRHGSESNVHFEIDFHFFCTGHHPQTEQLVKGEFSLWPEVHPSSPLFSLFSQISDLSKFLCRWANETLLFDRPETFFCQVVV